METDDFIVLQSADDRDAIVRALERGTAKPLDPGARAEALRDIDAVLEAHRRALEAGLDRWMTKDVLGQAAQELENFAIRLDAALEPLVHFSPLAETALRPNVFDPASPLGKLLVDEDREAAGLQAGNGTRKGAMRIYLDHFRSLVGMVDSVQAMVRVIAAQRSSGKPEDWPSRGWEGSPDGAFIPPLEDLLRALRRYAALAGIKAKDLRSVRSASTRHSSGLSRVVTLNLMAIWLEHTGQEASVAYWSHGELPEKGGAFLDFARAAVRVVCSSYNGQQALREILSRRVKSP